MTLTIRSVFGLRRRAVLAPALVTLLAGCIGSDRTATESVTHDSLAIVEASRAFSAAYVRNDTAALGQVYSDSAVLLPPNREVRGRAAIQRYFTWGADYRQLEHAMESIRLAIVGDLAIDEGVWTSTGQRGDADPRTASERYLVIWVRESNGTWRILYDMWHRTTP